MILRTTETLSRRFVDSSTAPRLTYPHTAHWQPGVSLGNEEMSSMINRFFSLFKFSSHTVQWTVKRSIATEEGPAANVGGDFTWSLSMSLCLSGPGARICRKYQRSWWDPETRVLQPPDLCPGLAALPHPVTRSVPPPPRTGQRKLVVAGDGDLVLGHRPISPHYTNITQTLHKHYTHITQGANNHHYPHTHCHNHCCRQMHGYYSDKTLQIIGASCC